MYSSRPYRRSADGHNLRRSRGKRPQHLESDTASLSKNTRAVTADRPKKIVNSNDKFKSGFVVPKASLVASLICTSCVSDLSKSASGSSKSSRRGSIEMRSKVARAYVASYTARALPGKMTLRSGMWAIICKLLMKPHSRLIEPRTKLLMTRLLVTTTVITSFET